MLGIVEFLVGLVATIYALYLYVTWTHGFWKIRGVPGPKPSFPFGNVAQAFLGRKSLDETLQDFLKEHENEPFAGYFVGRIPILVIRDPELAKTMLVKDFHVFCDRGDVVDEDSDPLSQSLNRIYGRRWKMLRQKITAIFSTGKLKRFFHVMAKSAENLESRLKEQVDKIELMECGETVAGYTIDVMGACTFGVDVQSLADGGRVFRTIGRKVFENSLLGLLKVMMRSMMPRVHTFFRFTTVIPEVERFFLSTTRKCIELRMKEKIVGNDLVDVLAQLTEAGATDGIEWTNSLLSAQTFLFFVAGLRLTGTAISFALWELSRVPEVQERLRQEILECEKNHDGKLTYEGIREMKYLDMVVKESLRKNSPVRHLRRKSMQDYTIPGTNVALPAGQLVQICLFDLHHDPKYYPNPDVFDPERFNDDAKKARHPMAYMPFGAGPKNCLALRFVYYEIKLALIKVIKNFQLHPTTKADKSYATEKFSIVLTAADGLVLRFERLAA